VLAALCFFFYCCNTVLANPTPASNCAVTTFTGTGSGSAMIENRDGRKYQNTENDTLECTTLDLNGNVGSIVEQTMGYDETGAPVAVYSETDGSYTFSQNTISNKIISSTLAINEALQQAGVGIQFRGFGYEWEVKKPDASSNLKLSVKIFGPSNNGGMASADNVIYSAEYNYANQAFADWTSFDVDHPPPGFFTVEDDWYVEMSMEGNGQGSGVRGMKMTFAYAIREGAEPFDPNYDYGAGQAFTDACNADPMYDSQCPGYQEAYTQQQCSADALYDPSCSGYEAAYYDQQCSQDALYDSGCQGYEAAYTAQQCDTDQSYDPSCPYYNQSQAKSTTPGMNVSGQGSDYIFIFRGNNPEVFATLQSNLNNLDGWMWECTSGAECGDNQVGYIKDAVQQGDDYIFLYTEDVDGNVVIPQSGKWYEFIEIDTACSADGTNTQRCPGYADTIAEQQFEQDCNANPQSDMMCPGYTEPTYEEDYDDYDGQNDGQDDGSYDGQDNGQFDPNMPFDGDQTGVDIQATTGIDLEASTGIDQELATGIDDSAARGEIEVDMQGVIDLMGPDENGDPFDLEGFENGPTGMPSKEDIAKEQAEFEQFFEEADSFGGAGLSDFQNEAFPDAFEELPVPDAFEELPTEDIFSERPLDTLEPLSEEQFEAIPELLEEAFEEAVEEQMIAEEMAVEEQMIAEEMAVQEAEIREELAEAIEEELSEAVEELAPVEELAAAEEVAGPSTTPNAPRTSKTTSVKKRALDIASEATTAAENTASLQASSSASSSADIGGSTGDDSSANNSGNDGSSNDGSGNSNSNSNSGSDMGMGNSNSNSNSGSDMGTGNSGSSSSGQVDYSGNSNTGSSNTGGSSNQNFNSATGQPALQSGDTGIGAMTGGTDTQLLASQGLSTQELTGEVPDLGSSTISYTFGNIDATVADEISSIIVAEINQLIIDITKRTLEEANEMGEPLDEVSEEELEAQQKLEDDLVQQAIDGDTSEDAQAALLGYNPNFREYVQPQMKVQAQWYTSDGIYELQQNYDNPNQRFFNGASDVKHRAMVRQQYGEK
jgi:hypothetical protein